MYCENKIQIKIAKQSALWRTVSYEAVTNYNAKAVLQYVTTASTVYKLSN